MQRASLSRFRSVLLAVFVALGLSAVEASFARPAQAPTETELLAKLKASADTADPKLISELADKKTRSALDGLIEAYKSMETIFMRREIVRVLARFDGVTDAEQPAMQKLMDVGTQAPEMELRHAAIDALGECTSQGKNFLALIVTSRADDGVRERALLKHLKLSDKSDHAWYKELWKPSKDEKPEKDKKDPKKKDPKKKDAKDKDDKDESPIGKKGTILNNMRTMAFEQIAGELTPGELAEATSDSFYKIRMKALDYLDSRGDKRALEIADQKLGRVDEHPEVRLTAARVIARVNGAKIADEFIKKATSSELPLDLRRGIAEILAGMRDEKVNSLLVNELGKGKTPDKLFSIWACKSLPDEKVDKALVRMLQDKDTDVVIDSVHALAARKYKEAVPALQKLVGKGKDRTVMRAALDAQSALRIGDKAWVDELVALTKSDDPELRNVAIQSLGATTDKTFLPQLIAALDDPNWSTRLAALEALERLKAKDAVTAIVDRMAKEDGRIAHEFANTLWRLTGQPYQDNVEGWKNWWAGARDRFVFPTGDQLEKIRTGEEEYRLRQGTHVKSEFFGIKIISHRVIFIIDVSGSMNEGLVNEYQGMSGQSRMEVAKAELMKCVGGLDPGAFFNMVIFSSGVERWIDGSLAAANQKNRDEAKSYIERLGAAGGTNLYGAVKEAFEDPDVDTIFIMSDGEPSVGEETDPAVIREHVKSWNEHRGIVLNTIAIGGQFQILEWIAEDSGGTHVKYE